MLQGEKETTASRQFWSPSLAQHWLKTSLEILPSYLATQSVLGKPYTFCIETLVQGVSPTLATFRLLG